MRTAFPRILAPALLFLLTIALMSATVLRNRIYANSVAVWRSMVESSPNKRRPHENYGQALSTAGRLEEALAEFETVLKLEDDGSVPMRDVYREIGVVQFRRGEYDKAIQAWKMGLQYVPYDAGLMNNLAIAFMKQKKLKEALQYAQTAARSNRYMPEPLNTLGEIYLALGMPRKAAESFKKYLYLRPEDSRGYWNTALALREAGAYEDALQFARQFLARERNPRFRGIAAKLVAQLQERINNR